MSIFDKRVNYKPFDYPEVLIFTEAMSKSYWVHSEVDFSSSVQDFKVELTPLEREAFTRSVLSISQVEVAVKSFWGDLKNYLPRPEFNLMGMSFGESESRHSEAYSRVLDVLSINSRFEKLLEVPAFQEKLNMINKVMKDSSISFESKLLFFTLVIENASLFSQFAIATSFASKKGIMKNLANMIQWSAIDENLHAQAGIWILNEIQKEKSIFQDLDIEAQVREYIRVEEIMLDWIFEEGEIEYFTKEDLLNYIKDRVDKSLSQIGFPKIFNISDEELKPLKWFDEEIYGDSLVDFFSSRPTDYTKNDKSITGDDLF